MAAKRVHAFAPKERRPVAAGGSPWTRFEECFRLNRAAEDSIKNAFFLKRNFVRAQKLQQFVGERLGAMMFCLSLNVVPHFADLRLAHANTVALLPCKLSHRRRRFMNPAGGIGFQISHQSRNGFVRSPAKQDMHMVRHAADFKGCSPFAANDAPQIIMDARANFVSEPRFAVFSAKYQMKLQIVKCPRQERSLVRRPTGAKQVCFNSHPRAPLRSTRGYQPMLLRSNGGEAASLL